MKSSSQVEISRLRRVEGRHNPLIKQLRQAFRDARKRSENECAIEGFHLIEEATRSGVRFHAIFFAESARLGASRLLPQIASQVEALLVPDSLFRAVVPSDSPQGVAALVQIRSYSFEELLERDSPGPLLVAAGVQDPGNLGTIFRSAEAFGAKGALLTEHTADAYNPKVIRASAGSVFRLPLAKIRSATALVKMRERGIRLLATSSHRGTPLADVDLSGPVAILVGNEGAGLDRRLLREINQFITIPHSARVESLNAAIAASIVLYEASRQR